MVSIVGFLRRPVVIGTMVATKAAIVFAIAGVFGWGCAFAAIATALISLLRPDTTTLPQATSGASEQGVTIRSYARRLVEVLFLPPAVRLMVRR